MAIRVPYSLQGGEQVGFTDRAYNYASEQGPRSAAKLPNYWLPTESIRWRK